MPHMSELRRLEAGKANCRTSYSLAVIASATYGKLLLQKEHMLRSNSLPPFNRGHSAILVSIVPHVTATAHYTGSAPKQSSVFDYVVKVRISDLPRAPGMQMPAADAASKTRTPWLFCELQYSGSTEHSIIGVLLGATDGPGR